VPSAKDVATLNARIDALQKSARAPAAKKAAAPAAKKAAAKKVTRKSPAARKKP